MARKATTTTTKNTQTLPRGIRLRNGRFFVDVMVKGKRKTATCATLEEAITRRTELKEALKRGLDGKNEEKAVTGGWTLNQALQYTIRHHWAGTGGEEKAVINANYAVRFFGPDKPLDKIDSLALDEYKEWLIEEHNNSNATINRKMSALSKLFTMAIERGKLKAKPKFPRLKETGGRIRFLSEDEERVCVNLLKQWSLDDHADAFVILIDTGMRPSELWRLKLNDIDFNTGLISIWENKTDNPRSIAMTKRVVETIRTRLDELPTRIVGDEDHLVWDGVTLFPNATNYWFERVWNKVKHVMKLDDDEQFVPYALRHTCCSRLIQRGVPLKHVKDWMGHKAIQTTMRYAHLAPQDMKSLASVLESKEARW
jgi:integrase